MISTMTSKGQVTVPKKFRDYLGLESGAGVDFSLGPRGEVIVRASAIPKPRVGEGRFAHLRGTLAIRRNTDALMALLRDYDADSNDPGLK